MADVIRPVTEDEVERAVRRLKSVLSVRVTVGEGGAIEEIHVLIDENRNPKQVARDIEAALVNDLGLRVDHRKISIAQVRTDVLPSAERAPRVRLGRITLSVDGNQVQSEVALLHDGRQTIGTAVSPRVRSNQAELVARATLDAVRSVLREQGGGAALVDVDLRAVEEWSVNGTAGEVLGVRVCWIRNGVDEELTGAAPVRNDAWKAAAAATLDAVNRRLGLFSD